MFSFLYVKLTIFLSVFYGQIYHCQFQSPDPIQFLKVKEKFTYRYLQILHSAGVLQLIHFNINSRILAKSIHSRLGNTCDHNSSYYLFIFIYRKSSDGSLRNFVGRLQGREYCLLCMEREQKHKLIFHDCSVLPFQR